eukprot:SAG11_NODE_121_length_15851_cov_6.082466_3_plen_94_part_00
MIQSAEPQFAFVRVTLSSFSTYVSAGDPVWGGGWLGTLDECALTYDVDRCFWLSDLAHTMAGLSPAEVYTMPNTERKSTHTRQAGGCALSVRK